VDSFIAACTDLKPNTWKTVTQTKAALLDFFGADRPLNGITPGDADNWKVDLRAHGYAPASIGTFVKRARQLFRYATRKGLLVKSPFQVIQAQVVGRLLRPGGLVLVGRVGPADRRCRVVDNVELGWLIAGRDRAGALALRECGQLWIGVDVDFPLLGRNRFPVR
jgi:hypothetical protein